MASIVVRLTVVLATFASAFAWQGTAWSASFEDLVARVATIESPEPYAPELDESLAGCVDGINIKLAKCGGITAALAMIEAARASGLKVMLGCMIESSLGISAAAQLAPLADYADLDGNLLIDDDVASGVKGERGKLALSEKPGLGVEVKPA